MKPSIKALLIILVAFLFNTQLYAGISISPVQLYLTDKSKQRSSTFTLESKGDVKSPRIFEAQAVKWTQGENGEDIYSPVSNIIINPKKLYFENQIQNKWSGSVLHNQ